MDEREYRRSREKRKRRKEKKEKRRRERKEKSKADKKGDKETKKGEGGESAKEDFPVNSEANWLALSCAHPVSLESQTVSLHCWPSRLAPLSAASSLPFIVENCLPGVLEYGDRIVSIDEVNVESGNHLKALLKERAKEKDYDIKVKFERIIRTRTIHGRPVDSFGQPLGDTNPGIEDDNFEFLNGYMLMLPGATLGMAVKMTNVASGELVVTTVHQEFSGLGRRIFQTGDYIFQVNGEGCASGNDFCSKFTSSLRGKGFVAVTFGRAKEKAAIAKVRSSLLAHSSADHKKPGDVVEICLKQRALLNTMPAPLDPILKATGVKAPAIEWSSHITEHHIYPNPWSLHVDLAPIPDNDAKYFKAQKMAGGQEQALPLESSSPGGNQKPHEAATSPAKVEEKGAKKEVKKEEEEEDEEDEDEEEEESENEAEEEEKKKERKAAKAPLDKAKATAAIQETTVPKQALAVPKKPVTAQKEVSVAPKATPAKPKKKSKVPKESPAIAASKGTTAVLKETSPMQKVAPSVPQGVPAANKKISAVPKGAATDLKEAATIADKKNIGSNSSSLAQRPAEKKSSSSEEEEDEADSDNDK